MDRLSNWLPKLSNPVRIGEHDQTAFALELILDYARSSGNQALTKLATDSAKKFFLNDKDCPLNMSPRAKISSPIPG